MNLKRANKIISIILCNIIAIIYINSFYNISAAEMMQYNLLEQSEISDVENSNENNYNDFNANDNNEDISSPDSDSIINASDDNSLDIIISMDNNAELVPETSDIIDDNSDSTNQNMIIPKMDLSNNQSITGNDILEVSETNDIYTNDNEETAIEGLITDENTDTVENQIVILENELDISEEILTEEKLSEPPFYTITYILNGGINNAANYCELLPDKRINLKAPTRQGFTFAGWFNKENDEKINYVINRNITIYAKWNPITYRISLNTNGGKLPDGTPARINYTSLSPRIDLPAPSRAHYTFGGWYADKKLISNRTDYIYTGFYGNVTLYAKWNEIPHKITYYMNDSSKDPAVLSNKHVISFNESSGAKLANPSRPGFTFKGFYLKSPTSIYFNSNEKPITSIARYTDKDVYLHAYWVENTYNVIYSPNGGKFKATAPASTKKYTDSFVLEKANIVENRTGYTFNGWNTKKDGTGTHYDAGTTVSRMSPTNKAKVTLYAEWSINQYGVYCDYRGGNMFDKYGKPLNPRYHTYIASIILKDPTKTGYLFKGWYKDRECTGPRYKSIPKSTEEENFYALWKPIQYNIQFKANGGKGRVNILRGCTYDQTYVLPENTFYKVNKYGTYKFVGWNTRSDGNGTFYYENESVSNLSAGNGSTVYLYAIWELE